MTAGFLIPGRHARNFSQSFDHIFGQIYDHDFRTGFLERKIQLYNTKGTEKVQLYTSPRTEKTHIINNPI